MFRTVLMMILYFMSSNPAFASCNTTIPEELRLPKIESGADYTVYDPEMNSFYETDPKSFEKLLKKHVADYNNISGSVILFPSGIKHVYRSAMLAYIRKTIEELILKRDVRSIVHLSNKKTVNQKLWMKDEKKIFKALGGKKQNYVHILDFNYDYEDQEGLVKVQKNVAKIIKGIEQMPHNVVIHCLGGEYRTELVFEVMQKCYNKVGMDNIIERYKCHTGSTHNPSAAGYKQENIEFIRDYPYSPKHFIPDLEHGRV